MITKLKHARILKGNNARKNFKTLPGSCKTRKKQLKHESFEHLKNEGRFNKERHRELDKWLAAQME